MYALRNMDNDLEFYKYIEHGMSLSGLTEKLCFSVDFYSGTCRSYSNKAWLTQYTVIYVSMRLFDFLFFLVYP